MKIQIFSRYTLFGKRWFFRIRAANGEPVAQSEAYHNRGDAVGTAYSLRNNLSNAEVEND